MRLFARCASAVLLLLIPLGVAPAAMAEPTTPSVQVEHSANAMAGQYIVTLKTGTDPAEAARTLGVTPLFAYDTAVRGFAATLSPTQLDAVRKLPGVEAVEENGRVSLPPAPVSGGDASRVVAASWGLARINQRELPLGDQFNVNGTGEGATVYIADTGIDFQHTEFGGRAVAGYDAIGDGQNGLDCNGHGTHVAGTVAGATYGVARKASLVSVRVLDCFGEGSWAGIIAGFDWVAKNAKKPAVLNASLGGPKSSAVNNAANALSDKGVLAVFAAGNESADACDVSPASASHAVTVGATDRDDLEADFSNYGRCLSLYAPGVQIVSAKLGGGSIAESGTSMASPHVAGVAALYRAKNPAADSKKVKMWLDQQSTKDVLGVSEGSPNALLYTAGL